MSALVSRFTPPLAQSLRLALRPAIVFNVWNGVGLLALCVAAFSYMRGGDGDWKLLFACFLTFVGAVLGQLVAVVRVRLFVVVIAYFLAIILSIVVGSEVKPDGDTVVFALFAAFGFGTGYLSLQHHLEIFAAFGPAIGWIGAAIGILNEEGRVTAWERSKVTAWLPLPLVLLFAFLVLMLLYLAAKQSARTELWLRLSGAEARRVSAKVSVAVVPKRNLAAGVVVALALFGITAVLAPYLWRTGKGDRSSKNGTMEKDERRGKGLDGEAIIQALERLARSAAKASLYSLLPLALFLLLWRPTKRAALLRHLRLPIVPVPPTERIDDLWLYLRVAAEDAGVSMVPSDSIEDLCARLRHHGLFSDEVARAAEIYGRTRYGFHVAPGDLAAMQTHAVAAATSIWRGLPRSARVRVLWRPLE